RIERKKFTKCSSLFELDVQSATEKRLFSCRSQFNHSLTQVSKHSYLYQAMDKIGRSRLMMFDQTSNTSSQLKLLQSTNNVIAWDYHVSSRVLGILQSKGEGASLSYGKLTDEGRLLIQQQLSIEKEFTSQTQLALSVKSQSSDEAVTVALTTNNMIHWYSDRGYINSNAVAHPRNIKQTIVTSNNKLLISLAQNRRKILLVGAQSNTKDISLLDQHYANDRMPRFRPKSDEISFLSDRNGSNQLWLVAGGQVSRLTNSEQGIDEYVWLGRGKDLVYLSNGELRLRKQQGTDIKLAIPQTKLNVLQAIDDHTLLLLLKDGSHGQIVKYSIKTAVLEVIYQGDISWGQLLESRLLFSDSLGTLFEFNLDTKNAQPKLIKPQADFMLHVLFITRDAGIYFQDKKFNIWRYDQTGKIELFDKYEKKTPFIYDIEPTKRRYLAHTFPEKFSQLAELSF
ncbi:MAG: TolB family protein, partial [Parashewanella sp.]